MRSLKFNAEITVFLEATSSLTPAEISEQIASELCLSADIPQAIGVVDYAIQDITVDFVGENKSLPDEEDSE